MKDLKTYKIAGDSTTLIREKLRDEKGRVYGLHLNSSPPKEVIQELLVNHFDVDRNVFVKDPAETRMKRRRLERLLRIDK